MMRILLLIFAISLIACSVNLPEKKFPDKEKAVDVPQEKVDSLVSGNNAFAWDIYRKITAEQRQKNVFFSPYSISTALAMTYAGAKKDTASQMQQVLRLPAEDPHLACSALIDQTQAANSQYKLYVANALWGQQGYPFLPEFLDVTGKNYGAGLYEVNFKGTPEQARKTINNWVEYHTEEKIKDLFSEGSITPAIRLVLTNAIYFKGEWLHTFDAGDTGSGTFHLDKSREVQVEMMSQDDVSFPYYKGDNFQVVQLPYKGDDLAMFIYLPNNIEGLAELEEQLTAETLKNMSTQMPNQSMLLMLPKFTATYKFSARKVLQAIGMKDAFSETDADFSGIAGGKDLVLEDVIHKAFVNVDEKGTEAAAATGSLIKATSAPIFDVRFIVDRPFLFTIAHLKTGSVLFMGRIVDPKSSS